ncbi:hypothetical protein C8F04DRAFT_483875 [Mycena alexandri]|uniref:Uncharacterized protein n=1 Tax=Mycena alexandri TaxID=1745969 RepID=A0AAD6SZE7_9AGAR|nr:hypothetical protein C8F04DRAFT_483875 [Mycena alexandri]
MACCSPQGPIRGDAASISSSLLSWMLPVSCTYAYLYPSLSHCIAVELYCYYLVMYFLLGEMYFHGDHVPQARMFNTACNLQPSH